MKTELSVITIMCLLLSCDFDTMRDNGIVKISNNTSAAVRVYYCYEEEEGSAPADDEYADVSVYTSAVTIDPESSERIFIQSNWFFDGEFTVIYGGLKKEYDIDYNILDYAEVDIEQSHFYDLVE